MKHLCASIGVLACSFLTGQELENNLVVSGFGTVGMVLNSTSQAEFVREVAQPRGAGQRLDGRVDTRLGIQLVAPFSEKWDFTLQALSKYRYDKTFTPEVPLGFLGWNPGGSARLRLGRLTADVIMNADSREVGYCFPWVRPPVEFFSNLLVATFNGLDYSQYVDLRQVGTLKLKVLGGKLVGKVFGDIGSTQVEPYSLEGSKLVGGTLEFSKDNWRSRLSYHWIQLAQDLGAPLPGYIDMLAQLGDPRWAQAADDLRLKRKVMHYLSAGLVWEPTPLQTQVAISHYISRNPITPAFWAGYVSCAYKMDAVTPYLTWSRIVTERYRLSMSDFPDVSHLPPNAMPSPEVLSEIGKLLPIALEINQSHQSTWALGARIEVAPQACLKVQADVIRGKSGMGLWANMKPDWDRRATVLSACLDFMF